MGSKKKADPRPIEKLMDISEVAKATGLSVAFLRKARAKYSLPFYKMGGSVRFRISEINAWIGERGDNAG